MTLAAGAAASSQASAASGDDIHHVAIFRFAKENIDDAMASFAHLRLRPGRNQAISVTTSTAV